MITALFAGKNYAFYLSSMLVALVALFMFFNMEQIRDKLGFETMSSLRVTIAKKNATLDDLELALDSKSKDIDILNKRLEVYENLNKELSKVVLERKVFVDKVVEKKTKKIKDLQASKGVLDLEGILKKPGVTEEQVENYKDTVSEYNIDALWEVYCEGDKECLKSTIATGV